MELDWPYISLLVTYFIGCTFLEPWPLLALVFCDWPSCNFGWSVKQWSTSCLYALQLGTWLVGVKVNGFGMWWIKVQYFFSWGLLHFQHFSFPPCSTKYDMEPLDSRLALSIFWGMALLGLLHGYWIDCAQKFLVEPKSNHPFFHHVHLDSFQ